METRILTKNTQVSITKCVSVNVFLYFFQVMEMLFIGFKVEPLNKPYEESLKLKQSND